MKSWGWIYKNLLLAGFVFAFVGCRKTPGEGGEATIKGVLWSQNIHDSKTPLNVDDYEDNQSVYISYGDKNLYDDDYKTSHDGSFQFKYLRKGTYKIFAYGLDSNTMTKVPIIKTVEIKKTDEVVDVSNFLIYKQADDGGKATITGKIYVKDYKSGSLSSEYYGPDVDVYLVFGNDKFYSSKTKTSYDGTFEFHGLRKGQYTVYAYSKDISGSSDADQPVKANVSLWEKMQKASLPDIVINK